MKIKEYDKFPDIYVVTDPSTGTSRLATRNLSPGSQIYGEQIFKTEGKEFRLWDPYRSKLAAAILRGIPAACFPIKSGRRVLYLGAGSGTTPSHVADIVGQDGMVFCIEFSPRTTRDLVATCNTRPNMIPILGDARKPEEYSDLVPVVDAIYCDVAQPEQAKLLKKNAIWYLKEEGQAMIAIKARSIDVTIDPSRIYNQEIQKMTSHFLIQDRRNLRPYHKDHVMVAANLSKNDD
ncbi:MAG: fibrillarin-like rRNA/tRNA 2'-O-methyltransferase [Candidatus Heimdallarchaeota archaeon]